MEKIVVLDSNIIIEILKGNEKIIESIEKVGFESVCITYITVMEVIYGARNKREKELIEKFLKGFNILYSNEDIDKLSIRYVNDFGLSHNAKLPDVIIASICTYHDVELMTLNIKDFRYIPDMRIYKF